MQTSGPAGGITQYWTFSFWICSVDIYEDKHENGCPEKAVFSNDISLRMSGIVNEHNIDIYDLIHKA
jgi:hypothetical protein